MGRTQPNSKGVHREVESEGGCKQISGLTNRNHIRLQLRIRWLYKLKSNNYSELAVINVADIWRKKCGTRGGLASRRKQSKKEVFQKIAERRNSTETYHEEVIFKFRFMEDAFMNKLLMFEPIDTSLFGDLCYISHQAEALQTGLKR